MNRKLQLTTLALLCFSIAFLAGCGSNTKATPVYSYYVTGMELTNSQQGDGPYFYAIAGSVAIDADGNVTGGEQDFNDGAGNTTPGDVSGSTPTADTIQAAKAALVLTNGQGTLTITTNNPNIGVNGVETFGIQFVNQNHAIIVQYDGSATSSGSLDLQTAGQLGGSYSFAMNGVDTDYDAIAYGGVFTMGSNGSTFSGVYDVNDSESGISLGNVFPNNVAVAAPDSYGRGYITTGLPEGAPQTLVYYIVGPEVARLIDVDGITGENNFGDVAVGSAFGQGSTTYSNSSISTSIFSLESNWAGVLYAAAGQIASPSGGAFSSSIGDEDIEGEVFGSVGVSGTYSISNSVGDVTYNGYGNLNLVPDGDFTVGSLGVYMTDPNLNLSDPNNTTGGGGALLIDLDEELPATGILVPQTDTTSADFTGNYAFGAHAYCECYSFDMAGQATMTAGAFNGSALLSAPRGYPSNSSATESTATVASTPLPDSNESTTGRYTLMSENETANPLILTISQDPVDFNVVVYQASGTQLFWLEEDNFSLFLGPIQQQASLTNLPQ